MFLLFLLVVSPLSRLPSDCYSSFAFICTLLVIFFFFSSRRRHTSCALVTGVQTCALPIWFAGWMRAAILRTCQAGQRESLLPASRNKAGYSVPSLMFWYGLHAAITSDIRSEARRVGTVCVSPCRSRWSSEHYKNNTTTNTTVT